MAEQLVNDALNMTEAGKRMEFYNILEQLLELLEENCDEGKYLEGANMLKELSSKVSFGRQVIQHITVLRSTAHYQAIATARPRGIRPKKEDVEECKYACERCGRLFYLARKTGQSDESFRNAQRSALKVHQERAICKSIQDERKQVAQGSAIVCYNDKVKKQTKAAKAIQKWYRSL